MSFCEKLKSAPQFVSAGIADTAAVETAQKTLQVSFAPEYLEYVRAYGVASCEGHEFTGICRFPRLDVVAVTQEERRNQPDIPANWYVVEQTHMDDIVIWQSPTGEVYEAQPGHIPVKLADSLVGYLSFSQK